MSSGQKVAFSLLISVLAFCAFTVVAFSGLFDLLEVNFYQPIVQEIKQKKIEEIAAAQNEYFDILMKRFDAFSISSEVKTYALSRPDDSDVKEREVLRSQLVTNTAALTGIRIIDDNGRNVYFSTFSSDIISGKNGISYRDYDSIDELNYDSVRAKKVFETSDNYDKKVRVIKDGEKNRIIFSHPFYNPQNELIGTILFYCDALNFSQFLYNRNLIDVKGAATLITSARDAVRKTDGFGGFVFGLPNYGQSSIQKEILANWRSNAENFCKLAPVEKTEEEPPATSEEKFPSDFAGLLKLLDPPKNNSLCAFSYKQPREDFGFITFLYNEAELKFPPYIRILLLATAFVTLYLAIFLILSLKHDDIVVIRDKVRRYENEFFVGYQKMGEGKTPAYLSEQKPVLEKRILKSLGKKGEKYASEFKSIFETYWQEMLASFGVAGSPAIAASAAPAINADELKEIVRSSLEDILESGKIQINAVSVGRENVAGSSDTALPTGENVESLEEAEEAEPEDAEAVEEVESVEEVEEVEEAKPEDVEAVEEVESLEEVDEAEPDDIETVEDVEPLEEVEEAEPEDAEAVEEVEALEEVEEAEPEDVEAVEEVESLEEVEEAEPEDAEAVEEVEALEEVEEAEPEDVEAVEEVESLEEVEETELEDAESVEEVESLEEVEEIEPEDVEPVEDVESLEEVEEAEPDDIEAVEDVEPLEEVDEAEPEDVEAVEDVESLEEAEEADPEEELEELGGVVSEADVSEDLEPIADFREELRFGDGRIEDNDAPLTQFSTITEEDLVHKFEEEFEVLPRVTEAEEYNIEMAKNLAALPDEPPRWTNNNDDLEIDADGLQRKPSFSELHDIEKLRDVARTVDEMDSNLEELEAFDPTKKDTEQEFIDPEVYIKGLLDSNVEFDDEIYKDENLLEKIEFGVPSSEIVDDDTDDSVAENFIAYPLDYSELDEADEDEKMYGPNPQNEKKSEEILDKTEEVADNQITTFEEPVVPASESVDEVEEIEDAEDFDDVAEVEVLDSFGDNMPFMFTQLGVEGNIHVSELAAMPDAIVQDSDGTFHVTEMPKMDSKLSLNMEFKKLVDSIMR